MVEGLCGNWRSPRYPTKKVSGQYTKNGWAECALQWFQEHLVPLGVTLDTEKTGMADLLNSCQSAWNNDPFMREISVQNCPPPVVSLHGQI